MIDIDIDECIEMVEEIFQVVYDFYDGLTFTINGHTATAACFFVGGVALTVILGQLLDMDDKFFDVDYDDDDD